MALYFLKHSYNHVSISVGSKNGKSISKGSHRPLGEQEQLPQAAKLPLGSATGEQIKYHATSQLECTLSIFQNIWCRSLGLHLPSILFLSQLSSLF